MNNDKSVVIGAVIVTYYPTKNILEIIKNIEKYAKKIVIVDNTNISRLTRQLYKIACLYKQKAVLKTNEKNVGLAKAQNQGINILKENKINWVLIFDQDSYPEENYIKEIKKTIIENNTKKLGIITPRIIEKKLNKEANYYVKKGWLFKRKKIDDINENDQILFTISSGSCINMQLINDIGKMKEEYFIDYIDSEFCIRAISKGWKIFAAKNAILFHQLGRKSVNKIFNKILVSTNHNPIRRYTIYRNRTNLWKKYAFKSPSYIIFDMMAAILDILRILKFENKKQEKLIMITKGIITGLNDKKLLDDKLIRSYYSKMYKSI